MGCQHSGSTWKDDCFLLGFTSRLPALARVRASCLRVRWRSRRLAFLAAGHLSFFGAGWALVSGSWYLELSICPSESVLGMKGWVSSSPPPWGQGKLGTPCSVPGQGVWVLQLCIECFVKKTPWENSGLAWVSAAAHAWVNELKLEQKGHSCSGLHGGPPGFPSGSDGKEADR